MIFDKPILKPTSPLPSDLKLLDWVEIPLSPWKSLPEVSCVFIIARNIYNNILPLQVSESVNLRSYAMTNNNIEVPAHNEGNVIFYVEVKNDTERRRLKKAIKKSLGFN